LDKIGDLIKKNVEKSTELYVPKGRVSWRLATGIPSLDVVLGGGFPGGSISQIYGPESSGKTSLAYNVVAQAVQNQFETLLLSLEDYSEVYAQACGIDTESPYYHVLAGESAEHVFNFTVDAARNSDVRVIVMDSISAASPKSNLEKKQKTTNLDKGLKPGEKARLIGHFIEQVKPPVLRKELVFVTVNQLRSDIGKFVSGLKPSGGMALQYFSNIKISLWGRKDNTKQEIETSVRVEKGKDWDVIPFGVTTLYFIHGKGVDIERDILLTCEKGNIVNKSGSWLSYIDDSGKEHKYQGMDNFATVLRSDLTLRDELRSKATNVEADVEEESILPESEE